MTSENPATEQLDLFDLTSDKTPIKEFCPGDTVSGYQVLPAGQPGQLLTGIIRQVTPQYLRLDTGHIYRTTAVFGKALQMELEQTAP
ncbi:MAG: hypothetical protein AAGE59_33110 [Cyanobacteria bacterium P01_F01_bin.86]